MMRGGMTKEENKQRKQTRWVERVRRRVRGDVERMMEEGEREGRSHVKNVLLL